MNKEDILEALKELRKSEKRKFDQTLDLIINLKEFDIKRDSVSIFATIPHMIRKNKICAFLDKESTIFDKVITKREMDVLTPKQIKKIVRNYDFCISLARLMPEIAKKFGRVLGPAGKMPDPKAGCVVMTEDDNTLNKLAKQLENEVKIKSKEPSLKIAIGKESMSDKDLADNVEHVFNAVLVALPRRKENLRSILLKFTMSKPVRIKLEK